MSRRATWGAQVRLRRPGWSVPWFARAGTALAVRNPQTLERARASMRLLLDAARPDADIEELARRYLAYLSWQHEVRWHPALYPVLPIDGLEHLTAVRGGVVVNFLHHGPFLCLGTALASSGREVHAMATPGLCGGEQRPWEVQAGAIASRGCHLFSVTEGSAAIRDRLQRGLVVAVASDVPGRTPVEFLGKRLVGSSGAARSAFATGCPVLALSVHRDADGNPRYRLDEPLRPDDFDRPEGLLQAMLRRHEDAVLAWPEAYYDPLSKWAPDTSADEPATQVAAG